MAHWRRGFAIAALGSIVAVLLAARLPTQRDAPEVNTECVHGYPSAALRTAASASAAQRIADSVATAAVGVLTVSPLFHDCQRFIVDTGGGHLVYDSVYSIEATMHLARLDTVLGATVPVLSDNGAEQLLTDGAEQVLKGNPATTSAPPPPPKVALLAVINAEGSYSQLGIATGKNYLFGLRYKKTTSAALEWAAYMVRICVPRICVTKLEARHTQFPEFKNDTDYPAVARWDWDATRKEQYIGVKCEIAWCEIGARGFTSSEQLLVSARSDSGERRVRLIKGWHDRQYLAARDDSGKLVPSGVLGIVLPHPELGDYDENRADDDHLPAARIFLFSWLEEDKAAFNAYEKKLNLVPNDEPIMVDIEYKKKSKTWNGRVTRHDKRALFLKDYTSETYALKHHDINEDFRRSGKRILGVVRWQWLMNDEGTWVRCSEGCCELGG